jgi:hypothetical protein
MHRPGRGNAGDFSDWTVRTGGRSGEAPVPGLGIGVVARRVSGSTAPFGGRTPGAVAVQRTSSSDRLAAFAARRPFPASSRVTRDVIPVRAVPALRGGPCVLVVNS